MIPKIWILAATCTLSAAGCASDRYSSDPLVRMEQMLIDTENERQMHDAVPRKDSDDQPSHLTPYRINGGAGPGAPSSI
jgi:hypothetical protein